MTNGSDRDRDGPFNEGETDTPAAGISLNAVFELLAHRHRRDLFQFFSDADDPTATVDEITTYLMTQEAQRTGHQPSYDQIKSELHHIHLPKLAEASVVKYDACSKTIRYWYHDQIEDLLDHVQSVGD